MYSAQKLALKYLHYWLTSANGRGHAIHSPFIYNFVKDVLNDEREFYAFNQIEQIRISLQNNHSVIQVTDFGAGSRTGLQKQRKISAIAKSSLKPAKYSQLLFKMVNYFGSNNILELGTSLGITSSYLASANTNAQVITMEGAATIASIAKENFKRLGIQNISLVEGNFDDTLPSVLTSSKPLDFIYIDGNHQYLPTVNYYKQILQHSTSNTVIIFDDIHWSKEMEEAWDWVKQNSSICLTVDLFFVGIVFFNPNFKETQHFKIRF